MMVCSNCEHAMDVELAPARCPNCGWGYGMHYAPPLQEIQRQTAVIRSKWSPAETRARTASAYRRTPADVTASTGVGVRRRGKASDTPKEYGQ